MSSEVFREQYNRLLHYLGHVEKQIHDLESEKTRTMQTLPEVNRQFEEARKAEEQQALLEAAKKTENVTKLKRKRKQANE